MKVHIIAGLLLLISCMDVKAQVVNPPLDGPTTNYHTQILADNNVTVPGTWLITSAEVATNSCTTTCFLEFWDTATVPVDGDYTGNGPGFCFPIPTDVLSNPWKGISMANVPETPRTSIGISAVVSSGADCYHLTKVPADISLQVQ